MKPLRGFVKPTTFVSFITFTPFNEMPLGRIHFAPLNKTLVICIIATNAVIIEELLSLISFSVYLKLTTNTNMYLNIK